MKKIIVVSTFFIVLISLMLAVGIDGDLTDNEKEWEIKLAKMRAEIQEMGYSFTVDYNDACKYSTEQLCGFRPELASGDANDKQFESSGTFGGSRALPSRYIGYYTPVKHQGGCGSCWAFCMVGTVEAQFLRGMGTEENLSEQWLLDCNPWGWDCGGGFINYYMFLNQGSPTELCYPYVGYQQSCDTSCPGLYFIYDWDWVGNPYSVPPVDDIKQAIMDHGSVAVGVATDAYFQAYSGGVFDRCYTSDLDHCVILCGWDDNLGPSGVWLLKNSWGPTWGGVDIDESGTVDPDERGFMWIVYGCNLVGYAAAYPIPYYGG